MNGVWVHKTLEKSGCIEILYESVLPKFLWCISIENSISQLLWQVILLLNSTSIDKL